MLSFTHIWFIALEFNFQEFEPTESSRSMHEREFVATQHLQCPQCRQSLS